MDYLIEARKFIQRTRQADDLLELRDRVPESPGEDHASIASHLLLERKLSAGEQTYGDTTIIDRGKTTRCRVGEVRRYQLVTDPCGPGHDEV